MSGKKSWQEKLRDKEGYPRILKLEKRFPCYNAVHKMGAEAGDDIVLVKPSEVVEIMKGIRRGKLLTITEICRTLAAKHGARACCTLTAGIFIMTAANAAEEAARSGGKLDIPYWRTLKANGYLNEKYPGGIEAQRRLLEQEGHRIVHKGAKAFVEHYEKSLEAPR